MTPSSVVLTPASEANLAALRRSLKRSHGFALHLLIADGAARAEARNRLRSWSGNGGVPELRFLSLGAAQQAEFAQLLVGRSETARAGVVVEADPLVAEETPILHLNTARDRLDELVAAPLVLILSPANAGAFSRMAPDLFDIRTSSYEVAQVAGQLELEVARRPNQTLGATRGSTLPDPELLRAQEASAEPPPPTALADAWLRLADAADEQSDLSQARDAAHEVIRLARPVGYTAAVGRALRILGRYQHRAGHLDAALQHLNAALTTERGNERAVALTWGEIADVYQARGELDEALRIRQDEELPVYERLGDVRSKAVTMGKIADVYQARGELDEALRILQDELLPIFARLGDVREKAVTMGKVADVYQARGELDEALRIRQDEELPVYERLGDVRSKAVTMGKIADVCEVRGDLDEALRIRQEEQLPVYERLGDVRSKAVTMGKIADVYQARGELDEALRIRQDEVLPTFARLGDVRGLLVGRANLALLLVQRNRPEEDAEQVVSLLLQAYHAAQHCGFAREAGQIEQIMQGLGMPLSAGDD